MESWQERPSWYAPLLHMIRWALYRCWQDGSNVCRIFRHRYCSEGGDDSEASGMTGEFSFGLIGSAVAQAATTGTTGTTASLPSLFSIVQIDTAVAWADMECTIAERSR